MHVYEKIKEINPEISLLNDESIYSSNISLEKLHIEKIIKSDQNSTLTDSDGNLVNTERFEYNIEKNLFSSIGRIEITDIKQVSVTH